MACRSCYSVNIKMLSAEMGIHFPGLENVNKPVVWVFPSLLVCFDCGFAEFVMPKEQRVTINNLLDPTEREFGRTG